MSRNVLSFIALAVSMLYGVSFSLFDGDAPRGYAGIGGVVVALCWIAVGMLGRPCPRSTGRPGAER